MLSDRNHVVGYISDEEVIKTANLWRATSHPDHVVHFDVTKFIRTALIDRKLLGRPFKLEISDHSSPDDLACVTYEPFPVMRIDKQLWHETCLGDPIGRYMVSHEIAHVVFHSHFAKAFSAFDEATLKAFPKEKQAEHHANLFADYFLVTDYLVRHFRKAPDIASMCNVELAVAERRVLQYTDKYLKSIVSTGECCPHCGLFLYRRGVRIFCRSIACLYETVA